MNQTDKTARSQTESLTFEFDLDHPPEKVWRALTAPALLAEWLLPVVGLRLEPGAAFTLQTQPYPGWDGTVNCRLLEIEPHRKLSYTWTVPFLDTVVTFTLADQVKLFGYLVWDSLRGNLPRRASLQVTEACNFHCKMCTFWQYDGPTPVPVHAPPDVACDDVTKGYVP